MVEGQPVINLIFRAVALAMGVAVVVLSILNAASADTYIMLLGIGLLVLALDALTQSRA